MGKIRKLSLTINAFDATELLESLITEIRDQIDHVAAIYQTVSYCGNPMSTEDWDELNRLKELKLIDELIRFEPQLSKFERKQECDKRNIGIQKMKENGSSHILNIDADEFYDSGQFRAAKEQINANGWPITYCTYVNYYKDFWHHLVYPFKPYVPFIHSTFFNYTYQTSAPGPTDPTRRINNPMNIGTHIFPDNELRMGHAAWIRKDIRKKLVNWSAKKHFNDALIEKAVRRWETWEEGQNAIMLFNTPQNEVRVKRLEKKMHKFDVPWENKKLTGL